MWGVNAAQRVYVNVSIDIWSLIGKERKREKGRERGTNERRKRENVECACIMCAI